MEYNDDVFIDVEKEIKLTLFLWDDLEGMNDIYLMKELAKFQDEAMESLNDLITELTMYEVVPLTWIPQSVRVQV